jgi:hypothetical protein
VRPSNVLEGGLVAEAAAGKALPFSFAVRGDICLAVLRNLGMYRPKTAFMPGAAADINARLASIAELM